MGALNKNEPPPTIVRAGLSEQEKRAFARKNNILRRHLTREQIRQLIAEQLQDSPDWADRRIAEELGVDHKTVGAVRDDLETTGEIPQLDRMVGKDGKARRKRKAKPPSLSQRRTVAIRRRSTMTTMMTTTTMRMISLGLAASAGATTRGTIQRERPSFITPSISSRWVPTRTRRRWSS